MLGPGIVFPAHAFEYVFLSFLFPASMSKFSGYRKGSPILVSRADPLNDIPYRGNVVDHKPTQIKIALQESFPELEQGCWRLDYCLAHSKTCQLLSISLQVGPWPVKHRVRTHEHSNILPFA